MPFPVIDAHQHVWDLDRARYDWLDARLAPIDRSIDLGEALPEMAACGVDATILVQAADNAEDTAVMRRAAAAHREVVAIVGYAPLEDPAATARTIDAWRGDPLLVGVRNLIHDRADPDWILQPAVDESLGLLEDAGLAFDLVSVLPRHLELAPILSERHPRLRIVIDHLSKPPIGLDAVEPWWGAITVAAENPLTHAKVSGLYSATADPAAWTTEAIRPFFDRALDVFGPERLMYGGDWPISVTAGGYRRVWEGLAPLFDALPATDRESVLGRTAARFYRVDPARLAAHD